MRHRPAKADDQTELDQLANAKQQSRLEASRLLHESSKRVMQMDDTDHHQVGGLDFSSIQPIAEIGSKGGDVVQQLWQHASMGEAQLQDGRTGAASSGQQDDEQHLEQHIDAVLEVEIREMKRDLDAFYHRESAVQRSYEAMVIGTGFRECCSLLQRLHSHLSIGEILEPSERINRRAQLIRVCGDYGKEWVPGTGTTTQFAFLVDEIRAKIAKQGLKVVFASMFRMEYHQVLSCPWGWSGS